jgi:hypothetical protein
MPRKPGWPRKKSRQNINANADNAVADLAEQIANGAQTPDAVLVG